MGKRNNKRERDPIAEYREWADNRYNPGHWLGANTPPDTNGLWSSKDRRGLGAMLLAFGAISLYMGFGQFGWTFGLFPGIPCVVVGLILLFSKDHPKRKQR